MFTKIMSIILIVAGIIGLVWGGITLMQGVRATRQTALALQQMGGGRFQGNGEGMLPGAALPRAAFGGSSTSALGGVMMLVSLLLVGVGEALRLLVRLSESPQSVEMQREVKL